MSHRICVKIYESLVKRGTINEDFREVYIYGLELILSFLISTSIILTVGFISKRIVQTLVFLVLFIGIRRFTGGYHADTYLKCQCFTVSTYIAVLLFSIYTQPPFYMHILMWAFGFIMILRFAPIENPNKPLTDKEKARHKRTSLILYSLSSIVGLSISYALPEIANPLFYTHFMIIVLMIVPIFERRKNHV